MAIGDGRHSMAIASAFAIKEARRTKSVGSRRNSSRRNSMTSRFTLLAFVASVAVAGCMSQTQMLNNKQALATQAALTRGKFDLNCPQATAEILSREVTQPAVQGPWFGGVQRAEYTVGVSGCGKRTTFLVLCPQGGEGCFAADPGARMR
jgi:hypothetical protein